MVFRFGGSDGLVAGVGDEDERGKIGSAREGDLAPGVSIREIEARQGRGLSRAPSITRHRKREKERESRVA